MNIQRIIHNRIEKYRNIYAINYNKYSLKRNKQAHKKPAATSNDVNIHVDEKRVKTITVPVGETLERPNDADIVTGRRVEGYYTTPAFDDGSEYEFGSTVEEETNLYAKLSDYIYFNGAMIKQFTPLDGADTTLNSDGTVTVAGANGSYVHKGRNRDKGETRRHNEGRRLDFRGVFVKRRL